LKKKQKKNKRIPVSSSGSDNDNHESLGADQEETHASTHDAALSSAMSQCRGGSLHSGIHSSTNIRQNLSGIKQMIMLRGGFRRIMLQLGNIEIMIIFLFQILKNYLSFTYR